MVMIMGQKVARLRLCNVTGAGGRRTSVRLEPEFWVALRVAALRGGMTVQALTGSIADASPERKLTSALRVWVLAYLGQPLLAGQP